MKRMMKRMGISGLCILLCLFCLVGCAKSEDNGSAPQETYAADTEGGVGASGASKEAIATELENGDVADQEDAYAPKIVKTAELSCETKDFDGVTAELEELVAELEGYIQESRVTGTGYRSTAVSERSASYILRIPAARLDEFLSSTGDLMNVLSTVTASEDVSAEYYDIQARLEVLESERKLLQEMLEQTNDINKMVTVEDRLYDVIYEIESYETMIRVYDGKIAYSTVMLNVSEVVDYTRVVNAGDSFGSRIKKAFAEGWSNFAEGVKDFCVWLVAGMPVILLLAILGTGAWLIIRAIRRKRGK